jgi:hypothetical protein
MIAQPFYTHSVIDRLKQNAAFMLECLFIKCDIGMHCAVDYHKHFKSVLWIRIWFKAAPGSVFYLHADLDPAFYLNADPDPWRQTGAIPASRN